MIDPASNPYRSPTARFADGVGPESVEGECRPAYKLYSLWLIMLATIREAVLLARFEQRKPSTAPAGLAGEGVFA